jgi:ribosomal protein L5
MLLALAARVCAAEAAAAAWPASRTAAAAVISAAGDLDAITARHGRAAHTSAAPSAAAAKEQQQQPPQPIDWQPPRLETLYRDHVARALLLKLDVSSVNELPSVGAVGVTIRAGDATPAPGGGAGATSSTPSRSRKSSSDSSGGVVEKWEMLLPALALEFLTGQPAHLSGPKGKYYRERGAASAAHAALRGRAALHMLEKLNTVAMPGQSAFEGVLMRSVDASGGVHFRLPSLLAFPDYEEAYETFEGLGSAHVSVAVDPGSWKPKGSRRRLGGDAPAEAEAARQRRRRGETGEEEEVDASPVGVARPRGAKGPAVGAVAVRTQLLLTGLQFPLLAKRRGPGGGAGDEEEE